LKIQLKKQLITLLKNKMENLQIIEQAINLAVTKGVYNLQEIDSILKALKELIKDKELPKNENIS